ncbi:MAG: hypothetical protein AAGB48_07310 [Planctomycetota bacterium]
MKPVLAWLKSNFLLVIFGILALVPPPVAFIVAGGLNTDLVETRQQAASSALSQLRGSTVTYSLPPTSADEEPISESSAPNQVLTTYYAQERARRETQIEAIKAEAVQFNQQGREPLIDGIFPEPAPGQGQLKRTEFGRVGIADESPESAYRALFNELRIRGLVDGEALAEQLNAQRDGQIAQITGDQGEGQLTPEQRDQLDQQMWAYRVSQYRAHAQDTAFYGDFLMLPVSVPTGEPATPPSIDDCFAWQVDFWAVEDILRAFASANAVRDRSGVGGSVLSGVIKRVDSIALDPPPFADRAAPAAAGPRGRRDREESIPSGPATLTGRGESPSDLYDIRYATAEVVIATDKLPDLFDALASTNFITVIDVDLEAVDPWDDLMNGYFYGEDAVVRMTVRLELLYLRTWTVPWMPPRVREALGIADPGDDDDLG